MASCRTQDPEPGSEYSTPASHNYKRERLRFHKVVQGPEQPERNKTTINDGASRDSRNPSQLSVTTSFETHGHRQ